MDLIGNKYRLTDKKIGSGGFSEVFLGYYFATGKETETITDLSEKGEKIAIKKISLLQENLQEKDALGKIQMEVETMQKLDHPNIVQYYDLVKTEFEWYIIMEYCNCGTFDDVIKYNERMSKERSLHFNRELNTYYYLNQLKEALNYIRRLGYIHRDIKPMNVLIVGTDLEDQPIDKIFATIDYYFDKKLTVKLADFGLAKNYDENNETLMNTICGSPLYMAPELILNKEYNATADLWSFGIIMYQMLFGVHPQNATSYQQLIRNLKFKSIDFHYGKNYTLQCYDLLTKLLTKDPKKRINWFDFFNHSWFRYWTENIDTDTTSLHSIFSEHKPLGSSDESTHGKIHKDIQMQEPLYHKMSARTMSDGYLNLKVPFETKKIPEDSDTDELVNSSIFSSQIGSPSLSGSPLGYSNLTRMKLDHYYPRSYPQSTYSEYASLIKPNLKDSSTHTSKILDSRSIPKTELVNDTSKSRIFKNVQKMNKLVDSDGQKLSESKLNIIPDYYGKKSKPITIKSKPQTYTRSYPED